MTFLIHWQEKLTLNNFLL